MNEDIKQKVSDTLTSGVGATFGLSVGGGDGSMGDSVGLGVVQAPQLATFTGTV